MKTFEVGFSMRGSVTVQAENAEQAMEYAKSSDNVSTDELLQGAILNVMDCGNDAITIDDAYETDAQTDDSKYLLVSYTIICGESHISKKTVVYNPENETPTQSIHEFFQDYWGEEETECDAVGARYNRSDWEEAIKVTTVQEISDFEAEVFKRYL